MNIFHPVHTTPPSRREVTEKKARYSHYKAELRADFYKRCGYCSTEDFYFGGQKGFHIDHFAPKSLFCDLTHEYTNLIYCCPTCNICKSNDWPSDDALVSQIDSKGYVDPCSHDFPMHLARDHTGRIVHLTVLGEYIKVKLKLSLKRKQIFWLLDRMEKQLAQLSCLIEKNDHDVDLLKYHYKLSSEYLQYIGALKSE